MAASSSSSTTTNSISAPSFPPTFPNVSDPASIPNTTFVQADPSTFRAVVQRLTGKAASSEMGPRRPPFKLHERRPTAARRLEIKLNNGVNGGSNASTSATLHSHFSSPRTLHRHFLVENMVMVSPVSPLEYLAARGGPNTPRSSVEDEDRAIAEKGYYLHPSPLSTPRGYDPPELLPLFPLQSPRDNYNNSNNNSSS
ncbi:VQ motif-containing protein 11-like [Henckelia pumila]|uniref:VQ motif-containing protein 11-like n=1 Tax=Henckelia pumila TaxID=405737 RepID=UPI003C6E27A5